MSKSNISKFPDNQDMSSKEKIRTELVKRVKRRTYTIVIVLAIIAVIIACFLIYEKTKVYTVLEKTSSIGFTPASGARTVEFAGNVMTYSKDGAGAIDSKGNLLWNITFDMQNPLMAKCNDTVAFADYGGSKIYVQTVGGASAEIDTAMPIRKITTSDNGVVAAVLDEVDVTWIYLYNLNGEIVAYFRTTMEKSGYPVDISLSPSGELVGVSYYYLDIQDVKSSVAFYNFGEVGKNNIDNYVSGYNYKDTFVPYVKFLNNDRVFALSTERLSIYEGEHKPVNLKDTFVNGNIRSVFNDDSHIALVFDNNDGDEKYRVDIYSSSGNLVLSKKIDFDYTGIAFGNDTFAVYGNKNILVSTYGGTNKLETEYEGSVRLMIPSSSPTKYTVVTDYTIDTVSMR